ncbi:MAG: hypothetical protein FJ247_13080 [Nitrospira sp.]|nr:hypothetical protein [Nitrospira sp.]
MESQKHSGLGIASVITSIVSGILAFLVIAIAGVVEASAPGRLDEESFGVAVLGILLLASLGGNALALGLGIGGLVQKEKNKILAILGTVLSGVSVVILSCVMILGNLLP